MKNWSGLIYTVIKKVGSLYHRRDSVMPKTGKSRNGALHVLFRDTEVTTSRSKSQTKDSEVREDVLHFILSSSVSLNFQTTCLYWSTIG